MQTDPLIQTDPPCPICQGNGTRGQMHGVAMAVIDCEVCQGSGHLSDHQPIGALRLLEWQSLAPGEVAFLRGTVIVWNGTLDMLQDNRVDPFSYDAIALGPKDMADLIASCAAT